MKHPKIRICAAPGCEAVAMGGALCVACAGEKAARRAAFDKSRAKDPFRKIYATARWKRERLAFLAAHPACEDCAALGITRAAEVVDHVRTVRERPDLAFDARNWRALCAACHNSKTARQDSGFAGGGGRGRNSGGLPRTGGDPNFSAGQDSK